MTGIIRISGESMSPEFNDGDYILISRLPLLFNLVRRGSVLVFDTEHYGLLVKKVSSIEDSGNRYFFTGTNINSLSTEKIGAVEKKKILGSVIFHFRKNRKN